LSERAEPLRATRVRLALSGDAAIVTMILNEVAAWLAARGDLMWEEGELDEARVADEIARAQFFIAERDGAPAGVVRFQLEDRLFWPDVPQTDAAFVHRLAVRRQFAGTGVSTALLAWSAEHARALGRRVLRLDCDAQRDKVRAVYEAFGFRLHSYRQVGPYYVARYEYPL
jgi:GNAT superfamily N-acetyltransferase